MQACCCLPAALCLAHSPERLWLAETIVKEPMNLTWGGSLKEAELVLFDATERLFQQTGFKPEDVSPCCSIHLRMLWA